jgi:plastocyanin
MRHLGLAALTGLLLLAFAPSAGAETREVTLRYGPIGVDGYGTVIRTAKTKAPQMDGFITGMHARVVDGRGRQLPVNRVMLHHVLFSTPTRRDETYCPGASERFYGTGEENQWLRLPEGYGYRITREDRWKVNFMLMNHKPRYDKAYLEYRMTIVDDPATIPVTPVWLGVTGCFRDPIFNVPGGGKPGSTFARSRMWSAPVDGRLVAAAGHAHGGTKSLRLSQPRCSDRALMSSMPRYGHPHNPVYNVLPVLHEPGPIDMSWWNSSSGVPIRKGEPLKVTAFYDGELPHTRAMGILHAYFAPSVPGAVDGCYDLPADAVRRDEGREGVDHPPKIVVPLTGIDRHGRARTIRRPPGPMHVLDRGAFLPVRGFSFPMRNVSIPAGASLTWRFRTRQIHNVTLANGPEGFASQHLSDGRRYRRKFTKPGTYRLFCSLHPIAMSQRVVVRRSR